MYLTHNCIYRRLSFVHSAPVHLVFSGMDADTWHMVIQKRNDCWWILFILRAQWYIKPLL